MQYLSLPLRSFILFSFPIFALLITTEAVTQPAIKNIPAVLVFGDSIVDTGNNNDLITPAKSNFPPYGRDFMGGVPTGRFSNGKVPSDLIVEALGIKELLPAYRDPNLQPQDLLTGVCFASGAAGYDPLSSRLGSAISLDGQFQLFKEYVEKLKGIVGEEGTSTLLAQGIVVVVLGSNDIDNSYFASRIRALQYDLSSYTNLVAELASSFVKDLYGHGVRRIGLFSAPPLGCLPSIRTLAGGIQRECSEMYNHAAQLYNTKLSAKLDNLNNILPNATVVYIDIYNPLLDLIRNPQKYGFEIANKGCCGTGEIEAATTCNRLSPHTCTDDSKYLFWDAYHPTEKAYKILVSEIFDQLSKRFGQ